MNWQRSILAVGGDGCVGWSVSVRTAGEQSLFLAKSPSSPNPHSDRRVTALDLDSQAADCGQFSYLELGSWNCLLLRARFLRVWGENRAGQSRQTRRESAECIHVRRRAYMCVSTCGPSQQCGHPPPLDGDIALDMRRCGDLRILTETRRSATCLASVSGIWSEYLSVGSVATPTGAE